MAFAGKASAVTLQSDPKTSARANASSTSRPGLRVRIPRAEPRLRTHLREARIFNMWQQVISDCLILDVSPHGARVRLPSDVHLPIKLLIFDERSNRTYAAEFRWRRHREIGLFFRDGFDDA